MFTDTLNAVFFLRGPQNLVAFRLKMGKKRAGRYARQMGSSDPRETSQLNLPGLRARFFMITGHVPRLKHFLDRRGAGELSRMSAIGYERTFSHTLNYVRFTSESRHYRRKIGSVPESRLLVSALPPKADVLSLPRRCLLMTQSGH